MSLHLWAQPTSLPKLTALFVLWVLEQVVFIVWSNDGLQYPRYTITLMFSDPLVVDNASPAIPRTFGFTWNSLTGIRRMPFGLTKRYKWLTGEITPKTFRFFFAKTKSFVSSLRKRNYPAYAGPWIRDLAALFSEDYLSSCSSVGQDDMQREYPQNVQNLQPKRIIPTSKLSNSAM